MLITKRIIIYIAFIFLIISAYAKCTENQININTADKNDLIKIKYIGNSRAEQLISLRPFNSLDELTKIKGIGDVYLQRIKEQGLACIDDLNSNNAEKTNKNTQENINKKNVTIDSNSKRINYKTEDNLFKSNSSTKKPKVAIIKLNPQVIKTPNSEKNKEKDNYALYGFIAFSVFITVLFAIKQRYNKKNGLA